MQQQKLGLALGLTLKDGSPIVVGGNKSPSLQKLASALVLMGYRWQRVSRDEAEDRGYVGSAPGEGEAGHHVVESRLPNDVVDILRSPVSEAQTKDGLETLEWHICQMAMAAFTRERILSLLGEETVLRITSGD